MVRILFTIANGDFAGGSRMAFYYARAFIEAGHKVVAVCGPRPEGLPSVIDALKGIGAKTYELDGFRQLFSTRLIRSVARIARAESADAIVSTLQADVKIATAAGALTRLPVVVFSQNCHTFGGGYFTRKAKAAVYGFAIRDLTRRVVCLSEALSRELQGRFGVNSGKISILANGIDLREYPVPLNRNKRTEVRKELGVCEADLLLVNVGRFDEQKGQLVLLEAFAKIARTLASLKLLLVGSATGTVESAAYARRMANVIEASQLQDRVMMPGWRSDVPDLLRAADLYVHSALWEGGPLPLAMLEAMAAGLPVIGTDCSGIPVGFVNGEHGIFVKAGDADALARAIESLALADAGRRAEMAHNARCLVEEQHDLAVTGRRFVELVCNERRSL